MAYDYVKRAYGVNPIIGQRVTHTVTKKSGAITRASSDAHYVHVRFDGQKHALPCHPTELEYGEAPARPTKAPTAVCADHD